MQKNDVLSALWGVELLRVDYAKQVVCDAHSGAIVLCANESNIARLECLASFTSVLKSVAGGKDKYNIQSAQAGILNALENRGKILEEYKLWREKNKQDALKNLKEVLE